jgi:hypothetical protein
MAATVKKIKMVMHHWFIRRVVVGVWLIVGMRGLAHSADSAARDIVVRFCELDAQGAQLTAEGWQKVSALFVQPGVPRREVIMVVRDFVVSHPFPESHKVGFIVDYTPVGLIYRSRARFSPLPSSLQIKGDVFVAWQSSGQGDKSAMWRIEGPVPDPHLTVDTAIRYVTQLRSSAKGDDTKKNADKTLAALKRLR